METVRLDRLTDLRRVVDETPDEKHDMSMWCGTACCSAGNYVKAYPGRGLFFVDGISIGPRLDATQTAYHVLANHFGISNAESGVLFDCVPLTRAEVIERIDALIAQYEPERHLEMKPERRALAPVSA